MIHFLVGTLAGLYECVDFPFDPGIEPEWIPRGSELKIERINYHRWEPSLLQVSVAEEQIWLRQPAVTGDGWLSILTLPQALNVIGETSTGNERFAWVTFDHVANQVLVSFELTNTFNKYILRRDIDGGAWHYVKPAITYTIGKMSVMDDGTIYLAACDAVGSYGEVWRSDNQGQTFFKDYRPGAGGGWSPGMFVNRDQEALYVGERVPTEVYGNLHRKVGGSWESGFTITAGFLYSGTGLYSPQGGGAVNPSDSDQMCTIRDDTLYSTDDDWNTASKLIMATDYTFREIALSPAGYILMGRGDGADLSDPHVIHSSQDAGVTLTPRAGAHADQAGGGGDSIPYITSDSTPNKVSHDGIAIFERGPVPAPLFFMHHNIYRRT